MNHISDTYVLAHSLEIRFLLALIIVPVSFFAIETASRLYDMAKSLLVKTSRLSANTVSTGAYSAAGAR